jgi:hypothetical protein
MKKRNFLVIGAICTIVLLITLACSLTGGGSVEPTATPKPSSLSQWASSASASSQYGEDSWSAAQVIGAPDTTECGDFTTAWASEYYDGVDWLEVSFATPVIPTQINIYETYNPSSIVKVEMRDLEGSYHTVYETTPAIIESCPSTLIIDLEDIEYKVNAVLITIDQSVLMEWNEIDAVQLVGKP